MQHHHAASSTAVYVHQQRVADTLQLLLNMVSHQQKNRCRNQGAGICTPSKLLACFHQCVTGGVTCSNRQLGMECSIYTCVCPAVGMMMRCVCCTMQQQQAQQQSASSQGQRQLQQQLQPTLQSRASLSGQVCASTGYLPGLLHCLHQSHVCMLTDTHPSSIAMCLGRSPTCGAACAQAACKFARFPGPFLFIACGGLLSSIMSGLA
jgi:hypothetical protein